MTPDDGNAWYLPRSRRKSTDTRRWLPFSRPFQRNRNSYVSYTFATVQRNHEERGPCSCVCTQEREKEVPSTSRSNQMRVNPGCFSALKDRSHVREIVIPFFWEDPPAYLYGNSPGEIGRGEEKFEYISDRLTSKFFFQIFHSKRA